MTEKALEMKLNRVHHIAINTLNIEESVQFYQELFGFTEVSRANMCACTLVYLKVSENTFLELFDLRGSCEKGSVPENLQGLRHIAFDVTDIEAWNRLLKEKNANFAIELCTMEQISKKGLLIRDPNGVIIELCEDI